MKNDYLDHKYERTNIKKKIICKGDYIDKYYF